MKVLMLGWELPPHNSGGLGVACFNLCKSLSKRNISIDFAVPYIAEHNIEFMNVKYVINQDIKAIQKSGLAYESYKYEYKDGTIIEHSLMDQVNFYRDNINSVIKNRSYRMIHAHDWLTFKAAIRAKEILNVPLIAHVHATEFDRAGGKEGNKLVHEIEYMGLLNADKIIAVSNLTRDLIINKYNIPKNKIDVVHNSININEFHIDEEKNSYIYLSQMKSLGYKIVSNIGRLTIQKGLVNLLQSARLVIEKNPKTIFLIVGSGDQYEELIELSADLGISRNVVFTNFQRGKNLRDAFKIADLFVLPSISEPFGLTALESMAYNTPVLVTYQSGVSETINNCLKVDFWDIQEIANKIIACISSESLNRELSEQGFKEISSFSWDHTANKIIKSYTLHQQLVGAR